MNINVGFKNFSVVFLNTPPGHSPIQPDETLNYTLTPTWFLSDDKKIAVIKLDTVVTRAGVETPLMQFVTASEFSLDAKIESGETFKLTEGLLTMLISLSVSTSRGALVSASASTYVGKLVMPIFDPKVFLKKPDQLPQTTQ